MKRFSFVPQGVCAKRIDFSLEDGKIFDCSFEGGCPGNLKAISKLVEGMDAERVVGLLRGNTCGNRGTSCADQFTKGLELALQRMQRTQ